MSAIECPALDGRQPLGFLAAVGLLNVLSDHVDPDTRLSWSTVDATAVIETTAAEDVVTLANGLIAVVEGIATDAVIPGAPASLPPPGEAPDRLRLPPAGLRDYVGTFENDRSLAHRWIGSLVTDLCLDDKGRASISLFTAPSGKQSMRTMLQKPLSLLRADPSLLLDALRAWRRVPGYTGEYLDHRVLFDAADAPDGEPRERGVPGATWLALMAYPLFRTTASRSGYAITSGWDRTTRQPTFRWPLWTPALSVNAVRVLLEHPVLSRSDQQSRESWEPLGVFAVHRAQRRRIAGRNFAGVLAPMAGTDDRRA